MCAEPRENLIGPRFRRRIKMVSIAEIAAGLKDAFRLLGLRVLIGDNKSDEHTRCLRPNVLAFSCERT
jgi:hypothetical protein